MLVGDPELVATDCRVSWAAGAVERALDETWSEIDEMVERTISALPPRSGIGSDLPPSPVEETEPETLEDQAGDPAPEELQAAAVPESEPETEPQSADHPAESADTAEAEEPDMDAFADPDEADPKQT